MKQNVFTAAYQVTGSGNTETDGVYEYAGLCKHRNLANRGLMPYYTRTGVYHVYTIGYRGCEGGQGQWLLATIDNEGCELFERRGPTDPYYARNANDTDTPPVTEWYVKEHPDNIYCFRHQPSCPEPTVSPLYEVTAIPVGWGDVTVGGDTFPGFPDYYEPGNDAELTPTPDPNWTFTGWSGDLGGSTIPGVITMDADKNVTANFEGDLACDLFLNIVGSGSVTVDPDGGTYDANTDVTLTPVADADWAFSQWGGDLSGRANPAVITMNADMNITATFSDDADGDGISNEDEDAGPNGGDANNDGEPDRNQPEIAVTKTYDNQHYVWLEVESPPGATLTGCQTLAPPDCGLWVEFPYGFFEFNIENVGAGGAATVSLHLPAGGVQDTYYKFGPRPGFPNDECYNFMFEPPTQTGAEINGDVITLSFVDGQRGDDDLAANGTIVDQGGPGVMFAEETLIGPTGGGGGTTGGGSSSAIGGCFVGTAAR
jgi:uncharacterized repeat protein (TIGR02543 family)